MPKLSEDVLQAINNIWPWPQNESAGHPRYFIMQLQEELDRMEEEDFQSFEYVDSLSETVSDK